ncbi:MAG: hypothetical protein J5803_04530 [Desulfovibrio sp.]|nr:hypothetical protein [Desulfovibrio sp.]
MRSFFGALLLCIVSACGAWAAEGDYLLKDGKVYRVDSGKEVLVPNGDFQTINTDKELWSWVLVDPELAEGMKGSESGIYFFKGMETKPAGFLPMKNVRTCQLEFSPSGEKLVVGCGDEAKQTLGLYFLEEGGTPFVKKAEYVAAGHVWWVDPHRFILTVRDESKGPRSNNDDWWCSAALYDSVENELIILKEATETKNYFVNGYDADAGTLDVVEGSVADKKDWNDKKKIKFKEITLPIPAAG